jgi:AcrR family transcriptional regulator
MAVEAPRLSRREQHERTRRDLIDAAGRVFARNGIERTSVEEIAAEAGYTKGAFYASFASKDELFLTIVDEKFSAEVERVEAMLGEGDDPERQARDAAVDFVRNVNDDPDWSRLFFEFTVRASHDPEFRAHLSDRYEALRSRLVKVFERWSAGFPEAPPIPMEQIATMTYCMANGFLMEQMIDPDLPDELYGSMMAIFLRGLQATSEDEAVG